jgi:hypothetical protein
MRLFLYPLILTILILIGFAEVATPIVQPRTSYMRHELPVHKTLYLERGIYEDQMYYITLAAMEWYDVTNGQVVFDIRRLPQTNINPSEAIVVLNVTPDYPEMLILDSMNHRTTLGLYNANNGLPSIELVDERITVDDYTAVVMHEMGHALGLEHPDDEAHPLRGVGSLMFSSIMLGNEHITDLDLKRFCQLYHCDASKFHGVPQIQ